MKIQLLSDLHLESHPNFVPQRASGADVLVLAGDIGSYQAGSKLTDSDFGLARFSPLPPSHGGADWPTPVLYVPGNHEYDALDFELCHARLQATCARLGITWLERETVVLQGVRFIGTTLWSDFDVLAPRTSRAPDALAQQLKAREKAFRAANFYLRKTGGTMNREPLLATQVRELALTCQAWLQSALNNPFDGKTVVVTHFAPSLHSADPRYGRNPGTAGFCNALEEWLPLATAWLHGHLHSPSDYRLGGCRVVANPMGYAKKGEQDTFVPNLCIEI
jgi:predicted phosphodiesterase